MRTPLRTAVLGSLAATATVAALALLAVGAYLERAGDTALRESSITTGDLPPALPTATMKAARHVAERAHHRTAAAVFAGGCFWGMEEAFRHVPGVIETTAGYTGGTFDHPGYRQVTAGKTGHAEAVRVIYDPMQVSYERLLAAFFAAHDPTWEGGPRSRYRSAIFFYTPTQRRLAERARKDLSHRGTGHTVTTQVVPADMFWPAEPHHQQYIARHAGVSACPL